MSNLKNKSNSVTQTKNDSEKLSFLNQENASNPKPFSSKLSHKIPNNLLGMLQNCFCLQKCAIFIINRCMTG